MSSLSIVSVVSSLLDDWERAISEFARNGTMEIRISMQAISIGGFKVQVAS